MIFGDIFVINFIQIQLFQMFVFFINFYLVLFDFNFNRLWSTSVASYHDVLFLQDCFLSNTFKQCFYYIIYNIIYYIIYFGVSYNVFLYMLVLAGSGTYVLFLIYGLFSFSDLFSVLVDSFSCTVGVDFAPRFIKILFYGGFSFTFNI